MKKQLTILLLVFVVGSKTQVFEERCSTTDRTEGLCVRIRDCPPIHATLQEVINGTGSQSSVLDVLRSFCSSSTLVCCPTDLIRLDGLSDAQTEAPSGVSLLPKDCGRINIKPARNGQAPLGAWPWMAIVYGKYGDNSTQTCGGVLISERYVLSVYQCYSTSFINWEFVTLGEYNLETNPDCNARQCVPPNQNIPIESIIPHPKAHARRTFDYDVALIRLAEPAQMYEGIVWPICLPVDPLREMGFSAQDFEGKKAWGAGWGDTSADTSTIVTANILQQVQLPIQTFPHCQFTKSRLTNEDSMICAGGEGNDFCKGDSGNPLTLTNEAGNKVFLIGLVSGQVTNGSGSCGDIGTQGLFTSVAYYAPWIVSNLESKSKVDPAAPAFDIRLNPGSN